MQLRGALANGLIIPPHVISPLPTKFCGFSTSARPSKIAARHLLARNKANPSAFSAEAGNCIACLKISPGAIWRFLFWHSRLPAA